MILFIVFINKTTMLYELDELLVLTGREFRNDYFFENLENTRKKHETVVWLNNFNNFKNYKNIKMVEAARTEAEKLLDEDTELKNHPLIKEKLSKNTTEIHFE